MSFSHLTPSSRRRAGVLLLVLTLLPLAVGCASSGAGSRGTFGRGLPAVAATPEVRRQEQAMYRRLNGDRAKRGLPPLAYDERLADVGRYHSADMRDKRFFAHDSPTSGSLDDRLIAAGYVFVTARENLSEAPDVQSSQDSLLASPGHFANIMASDITHVGVGIVRGGVEDPTNLMVTQVFARPGRVETPEAAHDAILASIQQARAGRGLKSAKLHGELDALAEEYIVELAPETTPSDLQQVGKRVSKEVSARGNLGLRGVLVVGQLLPDSDSLQLPQELLESSTAVLGLAVRQVSHASGRPMLQMLLLLGL